MASLRGALEAFRMREEKTKADMDRVTKEIEALRWESVLWKRREVEVRFKVAYHPILIPCSFKRTYIISCINYRATLLFTRHFPRHKQL